MWCSHCVEDQQVAWGPDYIACSGCGKLFEFPVSKSHRMIGKPKKFQEKKHKHPTNNMSSTSTKSHGDQELKRKAVLATQWFCWTGQFIGHGVFKKRSPALFDNLSQAVLMAPFCLT
ncbi:hypothetical protein KFK09_013116 [Dendrobium nobile]|uniref:Uncharacterized protein n=1 Tax=Dendrobium nobile TaxID=94219 RepID=A0A8T3B833_DENNO|nr:hypothetical protein KFK09_013116 [Dendrobium nobile]